jgi:uncharacterized protein
MRKVVHFEIPADDIDRAKDFYGSIFGWQLQTMDMGEGQQYTIAMTTPIDEASQIPTEPGAINGGMFIRSEETPTPVITIDVEDIEQALKEIEAAGGSTVTPRTAIPGMGAFGYFKDSEGNLMGLWETTA